MKICSFVMVALVVVAPALAAAKARAATWMISPYSIGDGTLVDGNTVVVGANDVGDETEGMQAEGIFGAGFITTANAIMFSYDLNSWDSYSSAAGWWDVFVVTINQQGYYWDVISSEAGFTNLPVVSSGYSGGTPIFDDSVLPGATWAFGGQGGGLLTTATLDPGQWSTLSMVGGDPATPYYVSLVLDTASSSSDEKFPSWGSFCVTPAPATPVPEPATVLLYGAGLLAGGLVRSRKKQAPPSGTTK